MKRITFLKSLLLAAGLMVGANASWSATTTVGNADNTSAFGAAYSDYYAIQPNRSLRLSFTNYSDKAENYHNWVAAVTTDADRDATGYSEYLILRSDNYGWGSSYSAGTLTNNYNWDTFKNDMDGSHVEMTISRSAAKVTVRADITTSTGAQYYEQWVGTCGDGTQTIRFFLTTELGHMTDIVQNSSDVSIYYYYQDYENATDASTWGAPTLKPTLVTGDETYGNYIQHKRGSSDNDRSAYTYFYNNPDFYEANSYVLEFDMAIGYGNDHIGYVGIFPDGWTLPGNNAAYSGNFLFKLVQKSKNASTYLVNGTETEVTLGWEEWHHYTITVNGSTKTANYDIKKSESTITNGSGSLNLGETNYKAKGLQFLNGRYYGTGKFDNFKIYGEGTEVITTSVSTTSVNLTAGTATIAVSTETNAVSSSIKHYYSTSALLTSPVEISGGSVDLASGTYYFYSVNTTSGSKSNSVQYVVNATETVSAPTVTCTGNTITLTAHGTSDAGGSIAGTYYVANAPSADPATDGTLLTLNTPTEVPQGYYYIYSVSEHGNVSVEPATAMSISRKQETIDFYTAADNGYTTLSNLGNGDSGDNRLSKVTNSAGTVSEFINGRIECSYANANGNFWWIRNNGKGNKYNGLFISADKSDDLYVKVSAQDVVVFTWQEGGLTFSGTPNVYGDEIEAGSPVVSGTKYMAKANGYIKVNGRAYTTIKSIVVYSDDADVVAEPVLSSSANIVNVIPGGSADDDAVITSYYTTNGDAPTTSSTAVADNQIVLGPGTYTVKVMSYNATTSTASSVESINVVVPATVSATLGTNGYGTFASPYALDLANLPEGLKAYKAAVNGTKVNFIEVTEAVEANTGLLLGGAASETYSIPVASEGNDISSTNAFLVNANGTTFAAEKDYTYYGLLKNTLTFATFDPATVAIPASKAYLKVADTNGARLSVSFDDDNTTTGISSVNVNLNDDKVYNLNGQRVNNPKKGLFIVNGKKFINK